MGQPTRVSSRRQSTRIAVVLGALAPLLVAGKTCGDEGLWLFNRPPLRQLHARYDFEPTADWLEHLQKSCVRFNEGGSGSFVSADGLVMANQHVGADVLPRLGDKDHNYYRDGFYAKTRDQEIRCDGLELDVLMSIEDVTARAKAVLKSKMTPEETAAALHAVTAEIEAESAKKTGLLSEVVSVYQGGEYHVYRYRRYTDVRVVFAPEQQIAFFGGDPDNFEYPRYDFDVYFFRVYEQGRPARVDHFLNWSRTAAGENALVFVAGNPGQTDRLATVAAMTYQRDIGLPHVVQELYRLEVELSAWSVRSEANAFKSQELLFQVQDGRKARDGALAGLLDPSLMTKKRGEEAQFRSAIAGDPALKETARAWPRIAEAQKVRAALLVRYSALEEGAGFNSLLFGYSRMLVRAAEERTKPDRDRLSEFTEARLSSLAPVLFTVQPIDKEYETFKLANSLAWVAVQFHDDPQFVRNVLGNKSPQERAFELVHGTRLGDLAVRKSLFEKGQAAVAASSDPMIELARLIDPPARTVRKMRETQVDQVEHEAYIQIVRARHALGGVDAYPDATQSLRLAFGTLKGYESQGKRVPYQTTFAGLYERSREHRGRHPFDLPKPWVERQAKLRPETPFNFICTADVVSGNSGSPVINRKGEVVGLIFDRNLQSLVLDFTYTDKEARALGVHGAAILEGLRTVYDAGPLVQEILSEPNRQSAAGTISKPR
jgi:hypothetical protein